MTLGKRFKRLRFGAEKSMREVESITGVPKSTIWRLENNKDINLSSFLKLAKFYKALGKI